MIKTEHAALGAGLVVAGIFAWFALRQGGPLPAPQFTESTQSLPAQQLAPQAYVGPPARVPHRYPPRVGHEITTVMHYGWSQVSVPPTPSSSWMTRPPENEALIYGC